MTPLSDIRVLDLADESGVLTGRLLADLGAEVILVEPPGGGRVRHRAPFMDGIDDGEHAYGHLAYNAGKSSVTIDLTTDAGRMEFRALADTADVIIETAAPGEMESMGLAREDLVLMNQGLVYVSITPFGSHSPWANRRGSDLIGAATGGILHVSGEPERPPVLSAGDMSYRIASLAACTGVLAALVGRDGTRQGRGAQIDISIQECVTLSTLQTANANFWRWYGVAPPRNTAREFPIVRCKDGRYAVTRARPDRWDNIREWALSHGLPVRAAAGDWQTANRSELASFRLGEAADLLEELARFYDRDEFLERGAGTCFVGLPLLDFAEMRTNEHFAAVEQFVPVQDDARHLQLEYPKSPFAGMRHGALIGRAPLIGEHNASHRPAPARPTSTSPAVPRHAKPLAGLRVLDISWVLAGPLATRILANLGAEVIKVESASRMDALRRSVQPPTRASLATSGWFNCANTAKLSATINTTSDDGRKLLRALAAKCDIVLDNLRTGVVERMGLAYEDLRADNPGVIVVHMPGCGRTGPWANMASFGNMMTASGGVNAISGFPGTPPTGVGVAFGDFVSPYIAASAALAAIRERDRTGEGQEIEVAQLSGMVSLISAEWIEFAHTGVQPERRANRDPNYAPHGVFPARGEQEWLAIAVEGDEQFRAFASVIGRAELAADPRFATHAARKANEDALDAIVAEWTSTRDRWDAADLLQAHGIAAAAVESIADQLDCDPNLVAHFHELEQPSEPGVTITVNGEPIRFQGLDPTPTRAPALGEHNEYVFRELLGLPEEEFVRLMAAGVIA